MSFTKINISKTRDLRPNVCGRHVQGFCKQNTFIQQLLVYVGGMYKYVADWLNIRTCMYT